MAGPAKSVDKTLVEGPKLLNGSVPGAVRAYAVAATRKGAETAKVAKDKAVLIASDRAVQVAAASAAGGAVVVGGWGAAAGLVLGGTVGAAVGLLPALLTFGLSIPFGATVGGGCGLVAGGAAGGATGLTGGGAVGYAAYTKREEIGGFVARVRGKISSAVGGAKAAAVSYGTKALAKVAHGYAIVSDRVGSRLAVAKGETSVAFGTAKEKAMYAAGTAKAKTLEVVSDKAVQVTAASATGGAVLLGTGGAATGLVAGSAIGAAVGVVPAIFTFGLSIPVFAVVGAGCGVVAGTAVGGATGLLAGGAGGYGIFTKREAISSSVKKTWSKVDGCAAYVKETASTSAGYVRAKWVGGTGGTTE